MSTSDLPHQLRVETDGEGNAFVVTHGNTGPPHLGFRSPHTNRYTHETEGGETEGAKPSTKLRELEEVLNTMMGAYRKAYYEQEGYSTSVSAYVADGGEGGGFSVVVGVVKEAEGEGEGEKDWVDWYGQHDLVFSPDKEGGYEVDLSSWAWVSSKDEVHHRQDGKVGGRARLSAAVTRSGSATVSAHDLRYKEFPLATNVASLVEKADALLLSRLGVVLFRTPPRLVDAICVPPRKLQDEIDLIQSIPSKSENVGEIAPE